MDKQHGDGYWKENRYYSRSCTVSIRFDHLQERKRERERERERERDVLAIRWKQRTNVEKLQDANYCDMWIAKGTCRTG